MAVVALALGMASCHEKKKSDVIIAPKPVVKAPKKTQSMSSYEQSRQVEWLGATYKVVVKRAAATDLPLASGDDNTKYYDNKIEVRILRPDGTEFFSRTFAKSDFNEYLDDDTRKNGALLGFVYVETRADQLVFAASVGSPDITSDEYIPLVVKIGRTGSMSIAKDTQLDTDGSVEKKQPADNNDDDDEDEGV